MTAGSVVRTQTTEHARLRDVPEKLGGEPGSEKAVGMLGGAYSVAPANGTVEQVPELTYATTTTGSGELDALGALQQKPDTTSVKPLPGGDATVHAAGVMLFDNGLLRAGGLQYGGLLPMTLIGIPLSRTSALWRAMGRSYEEAIAFHRALGHVMMALYTYHGVGYMVYWLIRGIDVFVEEMTDWLDCGKCTHINNLAGVISWGAGFVLWMTSLRLGLGLGLGLGLASCCG